MPIRARGIALVPVSGLRPAMQCPNGAVLAPVVACEMNSTPKRAHARAQTEICTNQHPPSSGGGRGMSILAVRFVGE